MLDLSTLGTAPAVPDFAAWDPALSARLHHGSMAVEAVRDIVTQPPRPVGLDIEAGGLGPLAFNLRCVTAAWDTADGTHSVILDPRRGDHAQAVRDLTSWAGMLVLQNASYDWPVLFNYGLVTMEDTAKVWDTVVAARLAYPNTTVSKHLADLVVRPDLLAMEDTDVTMAAAFNAAGYSTQRDGWENMDVDQPVYRLGAMADTVATLRLGPVLAEAVVRHLTSSPFKDADVTSPLAVAPVLDQAGALGILERGQTVERVLLRRTARGIR